MYIVRSLRVKFEFNLWFLRKVRLDIFIGLQYERPWLKGQRTILTFATYLKSIIQLNISIEKIKKNPTFST